MTVYNASTLWAILALPSNLSAQGSIPFVNTDNATIMTDVANFWWDQINKHLSINTNGDQTGTDSINAYLQYDSYWPYNSVAYGTSALQNTQVAGFTVSSSRGNGIQPSVNLTGDFIGKFSGWSYMLPVTAGTAYGWTEVGGINIYASGVNTTSLGAELRFFTKQDGAAEVEWFKLTNNGTIQPLSQGLVALGAANLGWSKINFNYTISNGAGNQTINTPVGSFKIAAGTSSATITNVSVSPNSIVFAQLQSNDATATGVKSVIPAAGSFTITLNANATAQVTVAFFILNTDS